MSKNVTSMRRKMLGRRALIAACVAVPAVAATGGTAVADQTNAVLLAGRRRGAVAGTGDDGAKIYELLDQEGKVVGYTLDDDVLRELRASVSDLDEGARIGAKEAGLQSTGVTEVAACVAAIAWFAAQTVFPTVRVASLAIRLGKLVSKYGARTVARIFMGARGIAGRTAQQEIKDFALAASGIGGLMACGI